MIAWLRRRRARRAGYDFGRWCGDGPSGIAIDATTPEGFAAAMGIVEGQIDRTAAADRAAAAARWRAAGARQRAAVARRRLAENQRDSIADK